ncbi:MAG: hypothetical protein VXW65_06505 [Pseudomonadota bacterium]|nr:hypothetical protein [Pseudomonadota bacterium]
MAVSSYCGSDGRLIHDILPVTGQGGDGFLQWATQPNSESPYNAHPF